VAQHFHAVDATQPPVDLCIVSRLFWPKDTPPSIVPPVEGSWQPPGLKQSQ
jgi:hypothetical protein